MIEPLRTLSWSTWLGWQIESNWADLRLVLLYLVVKPICGSLMLVCMFFAVKYAAANGAVPTRVPPEFLPYIYVSNACYGLVGAVMFGMSYVVISDRESYRMLKYIFISPAQFQAYFVGRGLARALEGVVGGVITISAGLAVPEIRDALHFSSFDPLWLIVFLAIGTVMLWSCGMLLASAVLNMARNAMFLSEGIAGVIYFLSGVVFPISVLPPWLQAIGMALPTTYWLEGMRRAITGPPPPGSPLAASPLASWTNTELALALAGTTVVLVALSQWFYRWSVNRAWRNGRIEETTGM
ncbi:ABC transporter permease [Fimbriiglobus ruber]|uniref:ABC-type multidrug transport system, permease component n=1 Tax=Fimbriiglobus ruber TaxID=1908690 RepID=A0A225DVV2_9BACT|nr:ABC transporter permease [Fimbriiglobus ruber]OWK45153.1 ABC-type multidrug transport system, permease component [Fimbriiglobus ruber]